MQSLIKGDCLLIADGVCTSERTPCLFELRFRVSPDNALSLKVQRASTRENLKKMSVCRTLRRAKRNVLFVYSKEAV